MKLHIGGIEKKEGWKILNIQKNDDKEKDVDFIGDISDLSQFDDGSIEEIYASHTLEHVNQKNIRKTKSRFPHLAYNNYRSNILFDYSLQ